MADKRKQNGNNGNGFKKGHPFYGDKDRLANYIKEHGQWNKGLKGYLAGEKHYTFGKPLMRKNLLRKGGLNSRKILSLKHPTSIEKTLYDYLLLKGILFEKQKLINGRFIVDVYIPSLNLVIEADGNYWHTLPRVMKKDKAENAYLRKCGFNLVRLTDQEINSGKFKERLVI